VDRFCSVVSIDFAPSALVLYRSLAATHAEFTLDVLCVDEQTEHVFGRFRLPGVRLTTLGEVEAAHPRLAAVRPTRLLKEYCWTAKSAYLKLLFDRHPDIDMLTYVDSDLEFYAELGDALSREKEADVYLYPQRVAGSWKKETRHLGDFNGGTMTFRRTDNAAAVLDWYYERCLEWCFARYEPERWSDQRYLDFVARDFAGVTAVEAPGLAVAPWNARGRVISSRDGTLLVDDRPIVFYHFASLRLYSGLTSALRLGLFRSRFHFADGAQPLVWRAWGKQGLGDAERALLWEGYVKRLADAIVAVRSITPQIDRLYRSGWSQIVREAGDTPTARAVRAVGRRLDGTRRIRDRG
jgi:hypothetical protein